MPPGEPTKTGRAVALPARIVATCLCCLAIAPAYAHGSETEAPEDVKVLRLSADQLLAAATMAHANGDFDTAERAYRSLAKDPSVQVRSEARFRLALMFVQLERLSDAALLLREILDEQPAAQRVRIELARVLELMGDEPGARKALREAQAGGLPPHVARLVDRYSAALRARKPLGASFEVAVAPDSNINRATRSDTLGTVLGDFSLDEDAQRRSGIGMGLRGQAYARVPLARNVNLLGRLSGSGDLYRRSEFNDVAAAAYAGPEISSGADRLTAELGSVWRWYGGKAYSRTWSAGLTFLHPISRVAQLRVSASAGMVRNRFNRLQDGESYSASFTYERALSARAGIGGTLALERQSLRDPGYSSTGGQLGIFVYREIGAVTLIGSASYGRLVSDERLAIYPRKRSDHSYRASLGVSIRSLKVAGFAPLFRVTVERNRSSIEIYDYRRIRTEIGFTRAF